jgi:hypothetical protein
LRSTKLLVRKEKVFKKKKNLPKHRDTGCAQEDCVCTRDVYYAGYVCKKAKQMIGHIHLRKFSKEKKDCITDLAEKVSRNL